MSENPKRDRIPPGQQVVSAHKWPIIGEREPAKSDQPWQLELAGLFERPQVFTLEQLRAMPQKDFQIDIHCVTRWSKLDAPFRGILLSDLLEQAGILPDAKFISLVARSPREHSTSLMLEELLEHGAFLALEYDNQPLPAQHGGPIRNIVPGKYFYKSVKWLKKIELLHEDRLGYWEAETGYHNGADPWLEQRYMAPTIDRRTAAKLIESKDFSQRDLRSINAQRMDLTQLNAEKALLRDADFRHSNLSEANFTEANLSNAHLEHANLSNVTFLKTDLEGANLSGADLSGADLTGASLIGASFCHLDPEGKPIEGATFSSTSKFPDDQLERLTIEQQEYLRSALPLN